MKKTRSRTDRYAVERRLAPHVDPAWAEAVLLELRLREVPGPRIGAVLAEVDAHVADSGQDAGTAFGDPVAYARELDLATGPHPGDPEPAEPIRIVGAVAAQLLGMAGVVTAVSGVATDGPATVTVGRLVAAGAMLLALGLLTWRIDAVLAAAVRRPVLTWVGLTGAALLTAAPAALMDDAAVDLPAWPLLLAGTVLLVGATVAEARAVGPADADLVVGPLEGPEEARADARTAVLAARLSVLLVPAATVVLAVVAWVTAG